MSVVHQNRNRFCLFSWGTNVFSTVFRDYGTDRKPRKIYLHTVVVGFLFAQFTKSDWPRTEQHKKITSSDPRKPYTLHCGIRFKIHLQSRIPAVSVATQWFVVVYIYNSVRSTAPIKKCMVKIKLINHEYKMTIEIVNNGLCERRCTSYVTTPDKKL